jgi:hypothetical protein
MKVEEEKSKQKGMKFFIIGGGDSSVGIPPSKEIVTFEGRTVWDDDMIELTKEILKEWDDNGAKIFTEKEHESYLAMQEEYFISTR